MKLYNEYFDEGIDKLADYFNLSLSEKEDMAKHIIAILETCTKNLQDINGLRATFVINFRLDNRYFHSLLDIEIKDKSIDFAFDEMIECEVNQYLDFINDAKDRYCFAKELKQEVNELLN